MSAVNGVLARFRGLARAALLAVLGGLWIFAPALAGTGSDVGDGCCIDAQSMASCCEAEAGEAPADERDEPCSRRCAAACCGVHHVPPPAHAASLSPETDVVCVWTVGTRRAGSLSGDTLLEPPRA